MNLTSFSLRRTKFLYCITISPLPDWPFPQRLCPVSGLLLWSEVTSSGCVLIMMSSGLLSLLLHAHWTITSPQIRHLCRPNSDLVKNAFILSESDPLSLSAAVGPENGEDGRDWRAPKMCGSRRCLGPIFFLAWMVGLRRKMAAINSDKNPPPSLFHYFARRRRPTEEGSGTR